MTIALLAARSLNYSVALRLDAVMWILAYRTYGFCVLSKSRTEAIKPSATLPEST